MGLNTAPYCKLAEHGGASASSAENFRRPFEWGRVGSRAANAMCPSGSHLRDWDPHRVRIEPVLQKAKAGAALKAALVVANPLPRREKLTVTLEGRGLVADQTWEVELAGKDSVRKEFTLRLPDKL